LSNDMLSTYKQGVYAPTSPQKPKTQSWALLVKSDFQYRNNIKNPFVNTVSIKKILESDTRILQLYYLKQITEINYEVCQLDRVSFTSTKQYYLYLFS
jgi:hypothetical protein